MIYIPRVILEYFKWANSAQKLCFHAPQSLVFAKGVNDHIIMALYMCLQGLTRSVALTVPHSATGCTTSMLQWARIRAWTQGMQPSWNGGAHRTATTRTSWCPWTQSALPSPTSDTTLTSLLTGDCSHPTRLYLQALRPQARWSRTPGIHFSGSASSPQLWWRWATSACWRALTVRYGPTVGWSTEGPGQIWGAWINLLCLSCGLIAWPWLVLIC